MLTCVFFIKIKNKQYSFFITLTHVLCFNGLTYFNGALYNNKYCEERIENKLGVFIHLYIDSYIYIDIDIYTSISSFYTYISNYIKTIIQTPVSIT